MALVGLGEATASGETAPGPVDGKVRYRVLAAVCSLAVVAYLHRVGFATAVTELKGPTGLDDRGVSHLMAAFLLAYGLVEIPFGVIGDRLGARYALTAIVVGWSILTGLIGLVLLLPPHTAWPVAYLLALRALFGAFQGGMFPLISRVMADWLPVAERGLAQGCLWTSSRVGGAISSLVVFQLFRFAGVSLLAFWLLAGVGFVWAAVFWPWFRDRPEAMPGVSPSELAAIETGRPKGSEKPGHSIPWRLLLSSRSAWCLCLMYGSLAFTGNFFITLLPNYLKSHRGYAPATVSWVASAPLIFGLAGCLLGGSISDLIIRRSGNRRWGRRLVGSFGLTLGAVGLVISLGAKDPFWLAMALGVAFLGNDLAMGPSWAACADIGEKSAGTLGGAMNMTGSLGGALGALVIGEFLGRQLAGPVFLVMAGAYLLGALFWLGVDTSQTLVPSVADDF